MTRRVPADLRNELAWLLARRTWTDGDLAGRAGLARCRVNRIKNRRAVPSIGEALAIARALRLPVAAVFRLPGQSVTR